MHCWVFGVSSLQGAWKKTQGTSKILSLFVVYFLNWFCHFNQKVILDYLDCLEKLIVSCHLMSIAWLKKLNVCNLLHFFDSSQVILLASYYLFWLLNWWCILKNMLAKIIRSYMRRLMILTMYSYFEVLSWDLTDDKGLILICLSYV